MSVADALESAPPHPEMFLKTRVWGSSPLSWPRLGVDVPISPDCTEVFSLHLRQIASAKPDAYVNGNPLNTTDPSGLDANCSLIPNPFNDHSCIREGFSSPVGKVVAGAGALAGGAACFLGPCEVASVSAGMITIGARIGTACAAGAAKLSGVFNSSATQDAEVAAGPDLGALSQKILHQMASRGWSSEEIQQAFDEGTQFPARNAATGEAATRYVLDGHDGWVTIENDSGKVFQVAKGGMVPNDHIGG